MKLVAIFLTVFVAGPMAFKLLTAARPCRRHSLRLLGFTAVMAALGLGIRFGLAARWGSDALLTTAGVLAVWLAWVGILAYSAQALRQYDRGLGMQRWTAVIGAIGTTIPWFGFASASFMGG
ncbi:MAG: hypothetical protein ACSHWZ_12490 [Sulfitobacter sp.]